MNTRINGNAIRERGRTSVICRESLRRMHCASVDVSSDEANSLQMELQNTMDREIKKV
jgi:hypothetical protein